MSAEIRVEGLAELRRALRKMEQIDDLGVLRDGLKKAAGIAADEAKRLASPFSSRAAASIRPVSGGNRAFVVGGKARLPWYGWGDFGSRTPVSGNPRSVGPWARSGHGPSKGRWIYPAIENKERQVVGAVEDAVGQALRSAGF